MPTAHLEAFGGEQITQHAAARKGKIEMQFVHPAHQREVGGRGWPWQVIDAAPADVEYPGLSGDRQIMRAVDHRFALSKPASAWRAGQKIVLQRQLSDLRMQHRQIHHRPRTVTATF
ncbi:hypothetical protein SAE02_72980 [Skermanella aerolata]|uniref:Uncharacterized protein n=1 Tax=Skermanella aerolata TaxID=393310 RepID=A0A512E3W0_9PROT|nr:hypothetical protein N826_36950 [Skermanella aerolata KACC 11604]GEO43150.1 hypothetical protein SAE02_72980 [Skermanella aerolata]